MARGWAAAIGVAVAACALAGAAAAESYRYLIVPRDEAAAKHTVLTRDDLYRMPALGGLSVWAGGPVQALRTPETEADRCNGYLPKLSDLVVTGDAASRFDLPNTAVIITQVAVMRTRSMAQADWRRTVGHPGFPACLRQSLTATRISASSRITSLARLPFSNYGPQSIAYRALVETKAKFRVAIDSIFFVHGRTTVSILMSTGAPTVDDLLELKSLDLDVADAVYGRTTAN